MSTTYTESEVEAKIHARLTEIVEKAHAEADRRGYCETFDEIAAAAGLPKRSHKFRLTVPVHVEVDAEGCNASDVAHYLTRSGHAELTIAGLPGGITATITGVDAVDRSAVERVLVFPQPERASASEDSDTDPTAYHGERRTAPDGQWYYYGAHRLYHYGTSGGWYKAGEGTESDAAVARTWSELVAKVTPAESEPSVGDVRNLEGCDYIYHTPSDLPTGWYLEGPVARHAFRGATVAELNAHGNLRGATRPGSCH